MDNTDGQGWDGVDKTPLCVTLERDVTIPGKHHQPAQCSIFRATEHSVHDETMTFFGLNVGPPNTVIEIQKENVRSITYLGDYETNKT